MFAFVRACPALLLFLRAASNGEVVLGEVAAMHPIYRVVATGRAVFSCSYVMLWKIGRDSPCLSGEQESAAGLTRRLLQGQALGSQLRSPSHPHPTC